MTIEEYFKTESISKEKEMKIKKFKKIFFIVCLSMFLFLLSTLLKWYLDHSKIQQISKEIDKKISIERSNQNGELVNPPNNKNSSYYYYAAIPFYKVGFSVLLSKNPDTVGFIHIRNTNVNYPIVQTGDNNYYLKHDFTKKENNAGWIFMDYRNHIDNLGDNTIIYGHARYDGTMFGSLRNTLASSWQAERDNYVIFLSTLKEDMVFQIFSIYTIKSEGYYIMPNFSSSTKKEKWLTTMKERNIAPITTDVNTNDKILTLSTCQNDWGGRIVIHAKLIKKQKR